jgi:hypothetical protein
MPRRKVRVTVRFLPTEHAAISEFATKANMPQSVAMRVLISAALKQGSEAYQRYVGQAGNDSVSANPR